MSWVTSLLAWVRRQRAPVADALLAAGVTAMVLVDLSWPADAVDVRPTDGLAVLLSLLQTVPLAFRRRAPMVAFVLTLVGVGLYYPLGYEVTDGTLATFVGVYTVAAHEGRLQSLVALGLLAVAMTWYWATRAEPFDPTTPVWIGILGLLSWGLGEYAKARRAYTAEVEALAERLERARALEARQAAWQERARLARELHDVIGHTVNVMVIQAGAGRRTLGSDRASAEQAFQTIESTGREALDELDRLLGILRTDEDEPNLPPPGLDHLRALAGRFEDAGLPVEITVEGDAVALPRSLDQSAYRIIQEALTNALRHADGTVAQVAIRYGDDQLELEVTNDGAGNGSESAFGRRASDSDRQDRRSGRSGRSGSGLIGIRERVALFGGDLQAGPRAGGGFVVRCRLPLGAGRR